MAILKSEMSLYKSVGGDGGRRSSAKITTGTIGNCIDTITEAMLTSGYSITKKLFFHIGNDADLPLLGADIFLDKPTPGDDWGVLYAGTPRDDAADHSSPRIYGVAFLSVNASAGGSTLVVSVEDSSIAGIFADGDTVYVRSRDASGNYVNKEKHVVSGSPVVSGKTVTITIAGTLANSFTTAAYSTVASAIDAGDVKCSVDNWSRTGSGTYDEVSFPLLTDNLGTIEQTWTFNWIDATTFSCVGDTVGALANGSTASDYSPINPLTSKPYFTLSSSGHGGTSDATSQLVMQTHGPEFGFYLNLVGPAGATAVTGNRISPIINGGTAP